MTAPCPGEIALLKGSMKSAVHPMRELDFQKYQGRWYQMYRIGNKVDYGDCSSATYDLSNQKDSF